MRGAAVALAATMACAAPAVAQQLAFSRVTHGGDETFNYRWKDPASREHAISFTLTRPAIREAEESFAEFSMEAMWRRLEAALRDETQRFGQGTRIELTRAIDGLRWTVFASDRATADLLSRLLSARFEREQLAYLSRHLRQKVGSRVMVDFAGATAALLVPMRPVADALYHAFGNRDDERFRIASALGFFQEIPYVLLEDKARRGGDFLAAPALLAQNRGDCDSKAVALAAVLRSFTPWRKLAVVTMPGHAILAVDVAAGPEEMTILSRGRRYVALEAAGPLLAPVGQVAPRTARYLREGREIEIWPLN